MIKLYDYILNKKTPLHLYYSSAYYSDPSIDKMELKGWQGSDLMFDIDADRYPNCNVVYTICVKSNKVIEGKTDCPNSEEAIHYQNISTKCIERAFIDVVKLYLILKDEFGFKDIRIYFSGNKGFHIKVSDDSILQLTRDERREITSYVMLENIDVERLFPCRGKKTGYTLFHQNERGLRRRVLKIIIDSGLKYERIGEYVKIDCDTLKTVIEEARVNIDPVVTMDTSRLSRFGNSLNCKSGFIVKRIDIDRFTGFNYYDYSPWTGRIKVKPLVDATLPLIDDRIALKRGEVVSMDSTTAIYLAFKGLVKIVDLKDFGVRNV